jgi:hypothetical protein
MTSREKAFAERKEERLAAVVLEVCALIIARHADLYRNGETVLEIALMERSPNHTMPPDSSSK